MQRRNTPQKREIFEAVQTLRTHPTAEELYTHLKEQGSSIGKATVYRVLHQMAEEGQIRMVRLPEGADHFDFQLKPHYHIICTRCQKVDDVFLSEAFAGNDAVSYASDYQVDGYHLVYHGICPNCQKAAEVSSGAEINPSNLESKGE